MTRERKKNKSLGLKLLLSAIVLLVVVSGCSNPSEKDISSSSGETVAELQTKVSKVSSEIEAETDQTQNHSEEEHNRGSDSQTDKTSSDQGMAMSQDSKKMGMDMHGKDMKMKDMSMKSKGEGMAMGQDAKEMGMGMQGKDMKMKDMPMKSKGKGMAMGQDAKEMGMGMQGKDMKMKDMPMKSKGKGMAMGQDAKGMDMMGMMHGGMEMKKMGDKEVPTSALPGFPAISHIYHVGATGFFLDHADHLQLSDEQKTKLESLKEASQKQQNEFQNKIEEAEKEVWSLTGSDQPDVQKILEKVKFSENLKTDKRLSFIKAVGEAASVLSTEQRELLASPKDADGDEEVDSDAHSH